MKYYSTRDQKEMKFDAAQVIKQGLASDGGLFVPEEIPSLTEAEILSLCKELSRARGVYSRKVFE